MQTYNSNSNSSPTMMMRGYIIHTILLDIPFKLINSFLGILSLRVLKNLWVMLHSILDRLS